MDPAWLYAEAVLVGDRYRSTLGDLEPLKASLYDHGQRHPVIVLDNHELLAGERRLAALRELGIRQVKVKTVRTVAEACEALKADAATVTDTPDCLPMPLSDRVAQVEPLYALRQREIERGEFRRPTTPQRGRVFGAEVYTLAAHALGMGVTKYTSLRFAYLISLGRRPVGRIPVSDMERRLAREALKAIDAGVGAEPTIGRLRAQLGYTKGRNLPVLPVDPERVTVMEAVRPPRSSRPRRSLLDEAQAATMQLVKAVERWQRITRDDRWATNMRRLPLSAHSAIAESHQWLGAMLDQLPAPNPKETQ